jgi:hypothetical protein
MNFNVLAASMVPPVLYYSPVCTGVDKHTQLHRTAFIQIDAYELLHHTVLSMRM